MATFRLLCEGALFITSIDLESYIPRLFFGALLSFIAVDLMLDWLWHSRMKLARTECVGELRSEIREKIDLNMTLRPFLPSLVLSYYLGLGFWIDVVVCLPGRWPIGWWCVHACMHIYGY